jgi:hypothetical protein
MVLSSLFSRRDDKVAKKAVNRSNILLRFQEHSFGNLDCKIGLPEGQTEISRCKVEPSISKGNMSRINRSRDIRVPSANLSWLSLLLVVLAMLIAPHQCQTYHFYIAGTSKFSGDQTFLGFFPDQIDMTQTETLWGAGIVSQDTTNAKFTTKIYQMEFDGSTQISSATLTDSFYTLLLAPKLKNSLAIHLATKGLFRFVKVTSNTILVSKLENVGGAYPGPALNSAAFSSASSPLVLTDIFDSTYLLAYNRPDAVLGNNIRYINVGATGAVPTVGSQIELTPGVGMSTFHDFVTFKYGGASTIMYNGYNYDPNSSQGYMFELNPAGNSVTLKAAFKLQKYGMNQMVVDNLNGQDYIYTIVFSTLVLNSNSLDLHMGYFKISSLIAAQSGSTLQTGDIFSTFGSKTMTTSPQKLLNAGSFQYIIGVGSGQVKEIYLHPKSSNFGKSWTTLKLPNAAPETSATYAYGFFRLTTAPATEYALYYQQTSGTDPMQKAIFTSCPAEAPYFKTDTKTCVSLADAQSLASSGYLKDDTYMEVESCTVLNCATCPTSAATCSTCSVGYTLSGNTCVKCNVANCARCDVTDVCAQCTSPFAGTDCKSCVSGYIRNTAADTCYACAMTDCTLCSSNNYCATCKNGKVPTADGKLCLLPAESCIPVIPQCKTCSTPTTCTTCNPDYNLSDDAKACKALECAIDNCKQCDYANHCVECSTGLFLSADGLTCDLLSTKPTDQTYDDFNAETASGLVQVDRDAKDFDITKFSYVIQDNVTGKLYTCPSCSAEYVSEFSKALRFNVITDYEILAGTLQVTFPLTSVKARQGRSMQSTSEYGYLKVDNLRLKGNAPVNNDKMAYNAFTGLNAIRFFASVILGTFNTAHAFWSTYQYSWLQLWSLLPGKFLSYPDRLLTWHYKWYLLVIDFGDPFKNWKDWNMNGAKCFAQTEYPISRLGCGFVDNFGQNFIIIFCVLAFAVLISSAFVIHWWCKSRKAVNNGERPQGRRFFRSQTQMEKTVSNKYFAQIYLGLGIPYFFRFMDAIQPSLIYFSMLQYSTYLNSTNIKVSVFFAVCFFVYYMVTTCCSVLLAINIWKGLNENKEEEISDLGRFALKVGGWVRNFSFQFAGYKRVDAFWKLLIPVVEYIRVILICIFMVALRHYPKTALGLVLFIEALRLVFVGVMHKHRVSFLYALEDYAITTLFLFYLVVKLASNDSYSESTIQNNFGWVMALFIAIIWGIIALDVVVDTFVLIKTLWQERRKKEKSRSSSERSNQVDILQLYTDPDVADDGRVDSPHDRIKQVPLSSGRRGDYNSMDMSEGRYQIDVPDKNQQPPLSSNRKANFNSRDMSERGHMPANMISKRNHNYDSREMSEGYYGYSAVDKEAAVHKSQRSISNKLANFDSREMSEGYEGYGPSNNVQYRDPRQTVEPFEPSPDPSDRMNKQSYRSSNKLANFDSRQMSEGYYDSEYVQSEKVNNKSYRSSNKFANFDSRQMSEGYYDSEAVQSEKVNHDNNQYQQDYLLPIYQKDPSERYKQSQKSSNRVANFDSRQMSEGYYDSEAVQSEKLNQGTQQNYNILAYQNDPSEKYKQSYRSSNRVANFDSRQMSEGYYESEAVQSEKINQGYQQNLPVPVYYNDQSEKYKHSHKSSNKLGNFDSRQMSEGYYESEAVQSEKINQGYQQNLPVPVYYNDQSEKYKQSHKSSNRLGNFDSRQMSEGYYESEAVQSEKINQGNQGYEQNLPVPVYAKDPSERFKQSHRSSNKLGNFDSRQMSEGYYESEAVQSEKLNQGHPGYQQNLAVPDYNQNSEKVKYSQKSSNRVGNFDSRQMSEGYYESDAVQSEKFNQGPQQNLAVPVYNKDPSVSEKYKQSYKSSNKIGNFDSRQMSEGYYESDGIQSDIIKPGFQQNLTVPAYNNDSSDNKPSVKSSNKIGNFDSKNMSEGYEPSPFTSENVNKQSQPGYMSQGQQVLAYKEPTPQESDNMNKKSHKSSNRVGNFDSRAMSEGYDDQTPHQSESVQNKHKPESSKRIANFESRDMSEGYQSSSNQLQQGQHKDSSQASYKTPQQNQGGQLPQRNYQIHPISERKDDDFDSRDMEEDY